MRRGKHVIATLLMMMLMLTGCRKTPHPSASLTPSPQGGGQSVGTEITSQQHQGEGQSVVSSQPQEGKSEVSSQPQEGKREASLQPEGQEQSVEAGANASLPAIDRMGVYDSKEEVALYLVTYGNLPDNYVTKTEAKKHGWEGGNVEKVMGENFCIGGDHFGNFEGSLPEEKDYRECDIDTIGYKSRGSRRLVFAEDISVIYYTGDHYDHFDLIYDEAEGFLISFD